MTDDTKPYLAWRNPSAPSLELRARESGLLSAEAEYWRDLYEMAKARAADLQRKADVLTALVSAWRDIAGDAKREALRGKAPRFVAFYERLNEASEAVLDRHADKSPRHYTIADEVDQ